MKATTDNSQPVRVQTYQPFIKVTINFERAGLPQPVQEAPQPVRSTGVKLDMTKLIAAAEARERVNALMGF